jgi:hypothetical protein
MAWAKPPTERMARFTVDGNRVAVSVDVSDVIDENVKRKLDSGLATTLVARAYLVREGSSRADALAVQTIRTAYDLWDEVYVSELSGESGVRVFRDKKREDAIHRVAWLTLSFPLLPNAQYRVAWIVELNPVSKELLAQVRKWLSRPREGGPINGESYFGSFVSLFVNRKVGDAEKVLQFRTQVYP